MRHFKKIPQSIEPIISYSDRGMIITRSTEIAWFDYIINWCDTCCITFLSIASCKHFHFIYSHFYFVWNKSQIWHCLCVGWIGQLVHNVEVNVDVNPIRTTSRLVKIRIWSSIEQITECVRKIGSYARFWNNAIKPVLWLAQQMIISRYYPIIYGVRRPVVLMGVNQCCHPRAKKHRKRYFFMHCRGLHGLHYILGYQIHEILEKRVFFSAVPYQH